MLELILIFLAMIGLTHLVVDSKIFNRYVKNPLWNFLYKKFKPYEGAKEEFVLDNDGEKVLKKTSWFRRRLVEVDEMMACYQCAGLWSGVFVPLIWWLSTFHYMGFLIILLYGFAGSYLGMLGATVLLFLNTGVNNNNVEDRTG